VTQNLIAGGHRDTTTGRGERGYFASSGTTGGLVGGTFWGGRKNAIELGKKGGDLESNFSRWERS